MYNKVTTVFQKYPWKCAVDPLPLKYPQIFSFEMFGNHGRMYTLIIQEATIWLIWDVKDFLIF